MSDLSVHFIKEGYYLISEFLDSGRKCISFRCLIRLLGISSHVTWIISLYLPLLVNITPLDADQFTGGCFFLIVYIVVLNSM